MKSFQSTVTSPHRQCDGELHLIVLWANARHKEKQIVADLKENVQILEAYEITWNRKNIARNFSRFYGVKLDNNSGKQKECGKGSFLLFMVWDKAPVYEFVETSRGHEMVNTRLFNLKEKYRQWTKGGSKIHATNSPKETNHDITLLLGKNYDDYLKDAPKSWDGTYKKLHQDIIGTTGWKDLKELFYVLNNTTEYVVLRGLDSLENYDSSDKHKDIDILAKDYSNFVLLLNGVGGINPYRPHFYVSIKQEQAIIDVWDCCQQYYDTKWSENMFATKVLENGFYQLNPENKFYEFVYHALIHKKKITEDYVEKATALYQKLYPKDNFGRYPFDTYYQLLQKFMYDKHYNFVTPKDKSVYFNETLINSKEICDYLGEKYQLTNIQPYMINNYGGSGYIYFTGYKDKQKLFIKWGGLVNTCKNEFKYGKLFYDLNSTNFIKPYFYRYDKKEKFVAMDFIEGENLRTLIENKKLSKKQKKDILGQLANVGKTLLESKAVHRDIRPENFILTPENQLKLIDNQFAVSAQKYKEPRYFRKHHRLIKGLGAEYAYGKFKWDDFYSLSKLMEYIGSTNENPESFTFIKSNQGKQVVSFSIKTRIKIALCKLLSLITPIKSWRRKLRGH